MVQWFDPVILADAALRVVLSSVFGAYSDKREMQAAIEPPPHEYGPGADGTLWIDFVADLGDGFDSTYAVASLLGQERLELAGGDGPPELPRGRVLVMGGDEVYPSPTREDYEDRFRGPYAAALPWAPPASAPDLFAVPGNHDWYDGLTNFLRFFAAAGGWAAGRPVSDAATSRCVLRITGGCWHSTSSSTPTSTIRRWTTFAAWGSNRVTTSSS